MICLGIIIKVKFVFFENLSAKCEKGYNRNY